MNAQQALDLATENNITVTVDRDITDRNNSNKVIGQSFKVGNHSITRAAGHREWCVSNPDGGTYCYVSGPKTGKTIRLTRGNAMKYALEIILGLPHES